MYKNYQNSCIVSVPNTLSLKRKQGKWQTIRGDIFRRTFKGLLEKLR